MTLRTCLSTIQILIAASPEGSCSLHLMLQADTWPLWHISGPLGTISWEGPAEANFSRQGVCQDAWSRIQT